MKRGAIGALRMTTPGTPIFNALSESTPGPEIDTCVPAFGLIRERLQVSPYLSERSGEIDFASRDSPHAVGQLGRQVCLVNTAGMCIRGNQVRVQRYENEWDIHSSG